jgi:hypothetical protein
MSFEFFGQGHAVVHEKGHGVTAGFDADELSVQRAFRADAVLVFVELLLDQDPQAVAFDVQEDGVCPLVLQEQNQRSLKKRKKDKKRQDTIGKKKKKEKEKKRRQRGKEEEPQE